MDQIGSEGALGAASSNFAVAVACFHLSGDAKEFDLPSWGTYPRLEEADGTSNVS